VLQDVSDPVCAGIDFRPLYVEQRPEQCVLDGSGAVGNEITFASGCNDLDEPGAFLLDRRRDGSAGGACQTSDDGGAVMTVIGRIEFDGSETPRPTGRGDAR
jgi:hypothetical protein